LSAFTLAAAAACFSAAAKTLALQVAGVFALINQALQFACLGLRLWNAPGGGLPMVRRMSLPWYTLWNT
jgi:hypothetical protein